MTDLAARSTVAEHASYEPLSPLGFLQRARDAFASRVAVLDDGASWTYEEFYDRCSRAASAIAEIADGRPVAVLSPNDHVLLEAHHAMPWAGVPLVALNTRLSAFEIEVLVRHSEAAVLIHHPSFQEVADHVAAELPEVRMVVSTTDYEDLIAAAEPREMPHPDERSVLSINYTSGTTGAPKGVMYHHRGAYLQALAMVGLMQLDTRTRYLWTLPMFHCNGWTFPWAVTAVGGTHVCLPTVDDQEVWRHLQESGITHMCGAPTVMSMLAYSPAKVELPSRVRIATGGSPPSPAILREMEALGFEVVHVYGLTEVYGPAIACDWYPEWDELPTEERALRKARQGVTNMVGCTVRVVDAEGVDQPDDGETVGEIVIRGNNVMLGYLKNPEATEEAFRGGWFHSGDLGVRHPDGYVELRDRSKDVIISGGENITSVEVEQVIADHPAVLEVAVVAMPHEKWGEVPAAFVGLKPGESATEEEIITWVQSRLARYKAPKAVIFTDLPKTSTGKIQKFVLREELWGEGERRIN